MRLALRSNPRQIRRLLNIFLLTKYLSWEAGSPDTKLLLEILGFQVGRPLEFRRYVRELTREYHQPAKSQDIRSTNNAASLSTLVPLSEFLLLDDDASDSKRDEMKNLEEYLTSVVDAGTTDSQAFLALVNLAQKVTPNTSRNEESVFTRSYASASANTQQVFHALRDFSLNIADGDTVSISPVQRERFFAMRANASDSAGRNFVSFVVRPRQSRILLYADVEESRVSFWSQKLGGRFVDKRGVGHHGTGDFEMVIETETDPGSLSETLNLAKDLITESLEFSLERLSAR